MQTITQIHKLDPDQLAELIIASCTVAINKKLANPKTCYSKREFANAIGKSESFVDQERRKGNLEWKYNGGTVSISSAELKKYI